MKIEWSGTGIGEVGRNAKTGAVIVEVDPRYFRPKEVDILLANASKAKEVLGWSHSISFSELIEDMINSDLMLMKPKIDP